MKSFLIIGMNTFGHHLCRELAKQKCEIMVADIDPKQMEDILPLVVSAKVADCTGEEVLRSFGVSNFDVCFVCMGKNFQKSLQVTDLLKELGAKKVISKADGDIDAKFLAKNGADVVIYPEYEAAARIAVSESSDAIFDCIPLTGDYSIYEIGVSEKWSGKTIRQLDFRARYHLSILAIKKGTSIFPAPLADDVLSVDAHILVLGLADDVRRATN